jgi:hypothetical protein
MKLNWSKLKPKPTNWFLTNIEYVGYGRAEFLDPPGVVEGMVKIQFFEFGEESIEMQIEKFNALGTLQYGLLQLLSGQKPSKDGIMPLGGSNICVKLEVSTSDGIFQVDNNIDYSYSVSSKSEIKFRLLRSKFVTKTPVAGKYLVLPLLNFLTEFRDFHPSFNQHPLRLHITPSIPEGLDENEHSKAILIANNKNHLIFLELANKIGFIEALPDYNERKKKLETGRERSLITAMLVVEIDALPADLNSFIDNISTIILLFGLATGTEVGVPWIEFRDSQGELVQRDHVNLMRPLYFRGHQAICGHNSGGIGYLVSKAQATPDFKNPYLRATIKHSIRGGTYTLGSIEDKISYLCRAFETLLKHFNLISQELTEGLDNSQKNSVKQIIQDAHKHIENLVKIATASDQKQRLRKIAGRVTNVANKEKDFGLAVTELLTNFGLADVKVVDSHFQANPRVDNRNNWSSLISYYRGVVTHEGFLSDEGQIDDAIMISRHLHDILVRIIFKIVDYDGEYQPTTITSRTSVGIDWVKSNTLAKSLGY